MREANLIEGIELMTWSDRPHLIVNLHTLPIFEARINAGINSDILPCRVQERMST